MKKIYNLGKNQVSFWKSLVAVMMLLFCCQNIVAQLVTIPFIDSNPINDRKPFGSFYGYERTAMIYTASEIGLVNNSIITRLNFFVTSFQTTNGNAPYTIRMLNTTASSFNATTYASEIVGATTVLAGNTVIPQTTPNEGWLGFVLTTPFVYTGNNIKIIIETNAGGSGNELSTAKQFRWTDGSSQTWQADTTAPTVLGTVQTSRPNIQLVWSPPLPPANDACSGALIATTFPYINLQTLGQNATNNGGYLGCGSGMNDGVWYYFEGTGANMKVDITGVDTTFDPKLEIYTGSCENLTCIASADFGANGANETITFPTVFNEDVLYFINIGHWQSNVNLPEGNFTIKITNLRPSKITFFQSPNNVGYENQPISIKVGRLDGTNGSVTVNYAPNDGSALGNIDYGSAVGTLTWADGDNADKNIIIQLLPDAIVDPLETFTMILSNPTNNATIGYNTIPVTIIDSNAVPANDSCSGALNAINLPYLHVQTLGESATNNAGSISCGLNGTNDGLWYKFTGNGANITVAISNVAAHFDPEIAIYNGSCAATSCINSTDLGNIGQGETLTIASALGNVYYINIGYLSFTYDDSEGNFKIDITTTALANDSFGFKNLKVYPNPVTNILNIENAQKITKITIINMLGQELITKNFDDFKTEVDFSELQSGNYFAKVYSNNSEQTIKIVKK